jgi:hypothetical protein
MPRERTPKDAAEAGLASIEPGVPKSDAHTWAFKPRFRRRAFGWRSQPAITRVKEAVSEIRKVAKKDPVLGAEGAVAFLERVSPALEQVDSSSGSIGACVNNAVAELVPLIVNAPADAKTRGQWLERLFAAHAADRIPYIERLAEHWGELCGSPAVASAWADELIGTTRLAFSPNSEMHGFFHGAAACLSALYRAGRFDEIIGLVAGKVLWDYKRWAVKALVAQGARAEAIRYAEACRSPWANDSSIDRQCEEILLASGLADEAYRRYGVRANLASTYLASFRAVCQKYPQKAPREVLADLVETTPGNEGKWFAAAKDAGLYEEALALAGSTPCDPRTLTRAARDFAAKEPAFAIGAGLLALHWLVLGYGYDITSADVWNAYQASMSGAEHTGRTAEVREHIRQLVASEPTGERFVTKILGRELALP